MNTTDNISSVLKDESVLYNCDLFTFIFNGIFNGLIVTVGIACNCLTKITLWDEKSTNPTSCLLICLAFTDNLVLAAAGFLYFIPEYVFIISIHTHTVQ